MTALAAALALVLHAGLVLGLAPLLAGLMDCVQARLLGRAGPPLLAPYHDLRRAFRKQRVQAESATAFSRAAPPLVLAAAVCAALLVPSFTLGMATARLADLLTVLALLGLARGALLLGALDHGTAPAGLAATRAGMRAALAVPAVVALAYAIGLLTGSGNIDRALDVLRDGPIGPRWPTAIAWGGIIAAFGLVGAVLCGRGPTATTPAEAALGAGREGLLLEYSGADAGLLRYAGSLQLLVWLTLIGALAWPSASLAGGGRLAAWSLGLLGWAAKTSVLAGLLAAYEALGPRLPTARVPVLLGTALVLASLAVVLLFAAQGAP